MKSTTQYLPEHFYKFYEALTAPMPNILLSEINRIIEEKERMLKQITQLKGERDPLACSRAGEEL